MGNLRELIPGAEHWPRFVSNRSEQFEARFVMVEVMRSPSLFFDAMVFRTVQQSWHPQGWGEDSPWMRMFRNARSWVA